MSFHFWFPIFNWFLMAAFAPVMIALTKRNFMVLSVIFGVIVAEYIIILGDSGMMMELFAGIVVYTNPMGMFNSFIDKIGVIVKSR